MEDMTYALPDGAQVGLAHPLHLDEGLRAAWGQVLADYELLPAFPQLTRPTHVLGREETDATALTRPGMTGIPSGALCAILTRRGWQRVDSDPLLHHTRPLSGGGVAVIECHPGVWLGEPHTSGSQAITGCWFTIDGHVSGRRLRVGDLDPVDVSEVLVDMFVLGNAGR